MAAPETAPASPILTQSFQEDPFPVIHRLRREDPVHRPGTRPCGG
jgi:hypothetical protein